MKSTSCFFLFFAAVILVMPVSAYAQYPYLEIDIFATFEQTIQQCALIAVGEVISVKKQNNFHQ